MVVLCNYLIVILFLYGRFSEILYYQIYIFCLLAVDVLDDIIYLFVKVRDHHSTNSYQYPKIKMTPSGLRYGDKTKSKVNPQ